MPQTHCPVCHGSGEYSRTCERSKVTGEYIDLHTCEECQGTGWVDTWFARLIEGERRGDAAYKEGKEEAA